jgi:acetyl esterase/lipase
MKNDQSKIHPELRYISWLKPRLNLNKSRVALINKVLPWIIKPKKCRDLIIENIFIDHPECDQKLRLRLYRPRSENKPLPALLWFHGGGYVIGTPEMDDKKCIEFARRLGMVVISVDYRLAPKHPFPAALEDGWAALHWAVAESERLGIDPGRIAVGGGSAGGGLAASLALLAHDRQEVRPAFQLLVYPMLDDRTVTRSDLKNRQFLIWLQESNQFGWESYLGQPCGEHALPMYAVPARREDLSGLPPAWIGVGSLDLFHDEVVAYAHNLSECGVKCELVVVPGAFHGFDVVSHRMPIIREFRDSQINALHENLNSSKNSPIKLKSVFISG